jgi:hypothetical protein
MRVAFYDFSSAKSNGKPVRFSRFQDSVDPKRVGEHSRRCLQKTGTCGEVSRGEKML